MNDDTVGGLIRGIESQVHEAHDVAVLLEMILNRPKVELTVEECGALSRIVIDLKCATGDIQEFWDKAFAAAGGQT